MDPKEKAKELIAHFNSIQIGETTNGEPVYLGQNNLNEVKNCVYITILEIKKQAYHWGVKSVRKYWEDVWEEVRLSK
jgi:hypothetical protein